MAEAILNIGYLIGKSKKRLHTRRIHNAVKKTGVEIIKSEMRKEDPNNKYDEDTRVIKIDRPLTKKEMIELCTSLGQIAIPQMSGETGTLWGPKQVLIDRNYDGGKFNIDYFKLFSSEDAESFDAEPKKLYHGRCSKCSADGRTEGPLYRRGRKTLCIDCMWEYFGAESFEAEGGCVHHNYPMAGLLTYRLTTTVRYGMKLYVEIAAQRQKAHFILKNGVKKCMLGMMQNPLRPIQSALVAAQSANVVAPKGANVAVITKRVVQNGRKQNPLRLKHGI